MRVVIVKGDLEVEIAGRMREVSEGYGAVKTVGNEVRSGCGEVWRWNSRRDDFLSRCNHSWARWRHN